MNKYFLVLLLLATISFAACTKVEAGYAGVRVNMLQSGPDGVSEIASGYYANSPNIEIFKFPLFTQTYKWTEGKDEGSAADEAIRFQTKEGMLITADIGITFDINKDNGTVKSLFLEYRRGIDEIIDSIVRNMVRDEFVKFGASYTADDIIGEGKVKLIQQVKDAITVKLAPRIKVVELSWLAAPRPPQNFIETLNKKVEATQIAIQTENQVRTAQAEAEKKVATAKGDAESILIIAKAQAEANRLISESLTPNLVQIKYIEKWNGQQSQVNGSGVPIVNLR